MNLKFLGINNMRAKAFYTYNVYIHPQRVYINKEIVRKNLKEVIIMRVQKRYMGAVVNEAKNEKAKENAQNRFQHLGKKQFERMNKKDV